MTHTVFVYGTLQGGESQGALLRGPRRPAHVRGRLYHLPAGYPALQLQGDAPVYGELAEVPDPRVLAMLDTYEGVAEGLYERVLVNAIVGLTTVRAWAWVMDDPAARGGRPLPSGRWTSPRRRR